MILEENAIAVKRDLSSNLVSWCIKVVNWCRREMGEFFYVRVEVSRHLLVDRWEVYDRRI